MKLPPQSVVDKLFYNAIESIRIGLEDLKVDSFGRLTSAIRNFSAGVQLLCKARLADVDENAIYLTSKKKTVRPKTIYREELQKAFETRKLDEGKINWEAIEKLSLLRNDFEHLFPEGDLKNLRQAVSSNMGMCLGTVNYLIQDVFQENPVDLLGAVVWQDVLSASEVLAQERKRQRDAFSVYNEIIPTFIVNHIIDDFMCEKCKCSILMPLEQQKPDSDFSGMLFECHQCGEVYRYRNALSVIIAIIERKRLYLQGYKHGDYYEDIFTMCPECGEEAYDFANKHCLACGNEEEYFCKQCGAPVSPDEMRAFDFEEDGLCWDCRHFKEQITSPD